MQPQFQHLKLEDFSGARRSVRTYSASA